MTYASVAGHRSMALDAVRNLAYGAALREVVRPDTVALDLGAGSGILGLIAARCGARRVFLVEPEDIVALAEEIVRANGLEGTVECFRGRIEDVSLPEPVHVVISVLTGNFLVTEDLLDTLFYARDHVLKPGGTLIPGAAAMRAVPVSAAALYQREVGSWSSTQQGVDLGAARSYAANTIYYRSEGLRDVDYLAEPATLHTLDFYTARDTNVHTEVAYDIERSGTCHGWVGWFAIQLGSRWLSTSPRDEPVHWSPAFLPLDPPMAFERGDRVTFKLDRNPLGHWTWQVQAPGGSRRHSTLLATPISPATLEKAALGYLPMLNDAGRALAYVLSQCNGEASVEAIAREVCSRYADHYRSQEDAVRFVQRVIKHNA